MRSKSIDYYLKKIKSRIKNVEDMAKANHVSMFQDVISDKNGDYVIAFSNSVDGKKDFSLNEFDAEYIGISFLCDYDTCDTPDKFTWVKKLKETMNE